MGGGRAGSDARASNVPARCRPGTRNHIKVAGAQARVGGTEEGSSTMIETQAPQSHHRLQAQILSQGGAAVAEAQVPAGAKNLCTYILEQRTWALGQRVHRGLVSLVSGPAARSTGSGPEPGFKSQLNQSRGF